MPREIVKRKKVVLTLKQKLEIIEKLKKGRSGASIAEEYGIGRSTVSDIKKQGHEIKSFADKHHSIVNIKNSADGPKTMKLGMHKNLDEALYKWYDQHASGGLGIRGVELQSAATTLAKDLGIENFKCSEGWLSRFRKRHLLVNRKVCGESASANINAIEPFRAEFKILVENEGLLPHQLYNFDETGLFWRALPNNTQASITCRNLPGRKLDKSRISVLLGANADGTHRLKPVVVGKSKKPRVLKDIMDSLPVHYYNSVKAWFTSSIFKEVFRKVIVPEITNYQIKELRTAPHNVRALILLDNAPAHPAKGELVSRDGRIKCMFLPANTTSVLQPMDQGVIQATKMRYRRHFMNEVLVVRSTEEDEDEDCRAKRTLENLRRYSLKTAIFNFEKSWKQLPPTALANAWNPLLKGIEYVRDVFEGFDENVQEITVALGDAGSATESDIHDWLTVDEGDPGYALQSTQEIAESVLNEGDDDSSDEDIDEMPDVTLAKIRSSVEDLLMCIDKRPRDLLHSKQMYPMLRECLGDIIEKQNNSTKQTKISSFFTIKTPSSSSESSRASSSANSRSSSPERHVNRPEPAVASTSSGRPEPAVTSISSGSKQTSSGTLFRLAAESADCSDEDVDDPSPEFQGFT